MKLHSMHILLLAGAVALQAQTVKIREAGGWLESAYASWEPVSGAERYNVYVTGGGLADRKVDDPLIRQYGGHFRADVPGLKAGSYTLKVAAVVSGKEGPATTTTSLAVSAHDRAGFAFSGKRIAGAYNMDGTPMTDAVIVYITEKTKDVVSQTITGATTNPCVGFQNILYGIKKGKDARPFIFRLVGNVTDPAVTDGGDIVLETGNLATGHVTIEGVGEDAVANGWGIRLKNASNVEIRNLAVMNVNSSEGDNIGLQQENDHVWVHNVDFFYGLAGGDADQAKGDGALDCKKSTYVTFSYNHFWDAGKSNLLGLSEGTTDSLFITYHHNWYDHSDSRHPRVRFYSAHVYNNYYDGNSKYGAGSTEGSSVFVEGNVFRNCKYPMLTAGQGTDIWTGTTYDHASKGTFSGETGGTIKAWNNRIEGASRFVAHGDSKVAGSTTEFDAYVAASRTEKVPATVKAYKGGATYNNFDTDASVMYAYTADPLDAVATKVTTYAGRVRGGDFKWAFNNAVDDTASGVNMPLKTALLAYKSPILRIQGEGAFLSPVGVAARSAANAAPSLAVVAGHLVLPEGLGATSVEVRSVSGALLLQGPIENSSLDLRGLGKGLYLARIATAEGVLVRPFALAR